MRGWIQQLSLDISLFILLIIEQILHYRKNQTDTYISTFALFPLDGLTLAVKFGLFRENITIASENSLDFNICFICTRMAHFDS